MKLELRLVAMEESGVLSLGPVPDLDDRGRPIWYRVEPGHYPGYAILIEGKPFSLIKWTDGLPIIVAPEMGDTDIVVNPIPALQPA